MRRPFFGRRVRGGQGSVIPSGLLLPEALLQPLRAREQRVDLALLTDQRIVQLHDGVFLVRATDLQFRDAFVVVPHGVS